MINGWKLRRELNRLWVQFAAIPAFLYEPVQQARYDRTRDAQIRVSDGSAALGAKVAIFLVFQPSDLAPSIAETCAYLTSCGYAVLLVANGGLPENGRARLSSWVWRFIERPNYGYDFGGYRDAILKLEDWDIRPDRLVIMNDSIWLPVHGETSPVKAAEALDDAVTGLLVHTRASRDREDGHEPDGMIESYFLSVPLSLQRQQAFRNFWRKLRLSNSKARIIHRGERGFSKAMHAAGIPLAGLSSRRVFLDAIAKASPQFLQSTLTYAVYLDAGFERQGTALLARYEPTEAWRADALAHVAATVHRRRFNASFYWAADRLALTNFMKKNRGQLFARMRRAYLLAVADGQLPHPPAPVMAEVSAMAAAESLM